jgi:phage terminase large subunit
LYTAYGGARGGGKTYALRIGAFNGALKYPGIKILIIRRTYPELRENHIEPMVKMVPQQLATYNGSIYLMRFENGSTIKFGHYNSDSSELEYQGQEYDWIFLDEATQFTEHQFRILGGCLRGVNNIPKHFYLTCNPGGIGHKWVKRLFIKREFKTNCDNPEENENPKDYKFIPALLEDNKLLVQKSPQYAQMLASLPEKMRAAHRYGDWDALSGAYFDEFSESTHVIKPFQIPASWRRYRAFDYGVRDMFACLWVAVDFDGRCYVYREYLMGEDLGEGYHGLIVPDAAQAMLDNTMPNEHIEVTFAPPDMWLTQSIGGKCAAEEFMINGISVVRANNNRVQGHTLVKQMLSNMPEEDKSPDEWKPQLLIFDTCPHLIDDLPAIEIDDKNPNDCAKEPHDITHIIDALRYFCISRTMAAATEEDRSRLIEDEDGEAVEEYDSYLTGGEISESYMSY